MRIRFHRLVAASAAPVCSPCSSSLPVRAERANYARRGSPDRYWTVGAGYVVSAGGVRAGYGRTWQRGPWRWHLEATLNLPVYVDDDTGLAGAAVATYALLVPIGFGVHYVFGDR